MDGKTQHMENMCTSN